MVLSPQFRSPDSAQIEKGTVIVTKEIHTTQQLAYSIGGLVKVSGRGRSAIYQEIAAGRLKARKAGRRTVILHGEAVAWLEALPAWEPSRLASQQN